jgi:hypothetical protein
VKWFARSGRERAPIAWRQVAAFVVVATVAGLIAVVERRDTEAVSVAGADVVDLAAFPQAPRPGRISTTWFCPGIAAGDGVNRGSVVVANPDDEPVDVAVMLLTADGSRQVVAEVDPYSKLSIPVVGRETTGVVVPVVEVIGSRAFVEQQLVFPAGDVTSQCSLGASDTWHFADGFTLEGSVQRINLSNPFPESAVVDLVFTTAEGRRAPPELRGIIVPARGVRSVQMSQVGGDEESILAVSVTATRGKVVASRSQHYLGGGRLGYSTMLGVPEPLDRWWFAGGNAGPNVEERLVLYNPGLEEVTVDVLFVGDGLTDGTGFEGDVAPIVSTSTFVPPGEVATINTGAAADLPRGVHGIFVSSPDGSPFIAEHVINQRIAGRAFTAVVPGAPERFASRVWRVPSGLTPGLTGAMTVVNTSGEDGTITVSAIGPAGEFEVPGLVDLRIGPGGLISIDMPADGTEGQLILRASVPVVVQRRLSRGHGLVGYSAALALPDTVSR